MANIVEALVWIGGSVLDLVLFFKVMKRIVMLVMKSIVNMKAYGNADVLGEKKNKKI
jgi:hypothetical protein